jgi:hypothetical protein
MPWKKARALGPPILGMELFNAQFRIQREAIEAAGHYIPLVVENVRGAQKWVGRARANYGSFYVWGDVGMVGRRVVAIVDGKPVYGRGVAPMPREMKCGHKRQEFQASRRQSVAVEETGTKQGGDWFGATSESSMSRLYGSKSPKRTMASALIAKIPRPLSEYIARVFKPYTAKGAHHA